MTFFESRRNTQVDLFEYYKGVVLVSFPAALAGTLLGVWFGTGLPALFNFAATLFLPVYFSLLLSGETRNRRELFAVVAGFIATPPLELLMPGWGLFVVAAAVGALACRVRS